MPTPHVVLVGDRNLTVIAHGAVPRSLALAAAALETGLDVTWLPTRLLADEVTATLAGADGVWCVPGSPYVSTKGALRAIRFAREHGVPFLGTCGGAQHAMMEYAANVLDMPSSHAELEPDVMHPLIAPLDCPLVEETGAVRLGPASRMRTLYGADDAIETYHCRYGLSVRYEGTLFARDLHVAARDTAGDVRAVELEGHPFFMGTLFQPERAALRGERHVVPHAFMVAVLAHANAPAAAGR